MDPIQGLSRLSVPGGAEIIQDRFHGRQTLAFAWGSAEALKTVFVVGG